LKPEGKIGHFAGTFPFGFIVIASRFHARRAGRGSQIFVTPIPAGYWIIVGLRKKWTGILLLHSHRRYERTHMLYTTKRHLRYLAMLVWYIGFVALALKS